MHTSDLSIVILNWNMRDLLLRCLQCAYAAFAGFALDAIVVDNASSDDSVAAVREHFPQVRTIENGENVGFARGNNQGVKASHAPYVLLLNSDAFLTEQALSAMLDLIKREPRAAAVGAHLRFADGAFQASHTHFPNLWREFLILSGVGRMLKGSWYPNHGEAQDNGAQAVECVNGACILVRRDAYLEIGGLDEGFFMYCEEVDLCYRFRRRGWQVWYQPAARVTHIGSASSKHRPLEQERDMYRGRLRFFRKHYGSASALALKSELLAFTAVKSVAHGTMRVLTKGRRSRKTVPLRDIAVL